MRTPIFICDGKDLIAFASIEAATAFVEPYDVDDGTVYDAEGRLLAFDTEGPGRVWAKRVVLREREPTPSHEAELRNAIVRAMRSAGVAVDPSTRLAELVDAALARFEA